MCIRDRQYLVAREAGRGSKKPAEVVGWLVTISSRMKRRACLLYTSDAADERSSVDLGGRRIIKKKT